MARGRGRDGTVTLPASVSQRHERPRPLGTTAILMKSPVHTRVLEREFSPIFSWPPLEDANHFMEKRRTWKSRRVNVGRGMGEWRWGPVSLVTALQMTRKRSWPQCKRKGSCWWLPAMLLLRRNVRGSLSLLQRIKDGYFISHMTTCVNERPNNFQCLFVYISIS